MRHGSDGPTTPDSPLRPSRRGPRGLSLTPRRFSHRPVFARLQLSTRRRARATWLVAYSAVTLPSTGPHESSGYDPKTSEDGCPLRSLRALASYAVWSSRSFGVRSEGGVPNSSPSEPRPDLREGCGFDPVGTISAPKRHPSGWVPRWGPVKHSPCYPAKNVILSPREQRFQN